jgi:hypothetical protein
MNLLTIISVIGIIAVCWAMAKYNKSDNLFWILLVSLFAGMAGGAIVNKTSKESNDEKKINLTQVYNPTQVSPANCVDLYTVLGDALAYTANPAVKDIEVPVRDSKIKSSAPSMIFGEIRGQPTNYFNPLNRGRPGMPFDTS